MNLTILLEWNAACGIPKSKVEDLALSMTKYVAPRNYGNDVQQFFITLSFNSAVSTVVQEYDAEARLIDIDVRLNVKKLKIANWKNKKKVIISALVERLKQLKNSHKFENFEVDTFTQDLKKASEQLHW